MLSRCVRLAAQRDFVFVGGPPTLHRRAAEHGTGLAARMRRRPPLPFALGSESEVGAWQNMRTRLLRVNRPTGQPANLHKVCTRTSG